MGEYFAQIRYDHYSPPISNVGREGSYLLRETFLFGGTIGPLFVPT